MNFYTSSGPFGGISYEPNDYYEAVATGIVVNSLVSLGAGYLYGVVADANPEKSALAFLSYAVSVTVWKIFVDYATGGLKEQPKVYTTAMAIGEGMIGVIEIVALRRMQLIGGIGTIVCAAAFYARTIYRLYEFHSIQK